MKRLYIMLLATLCTAGVMAQGQRLKQRIIDRDYYPMDSATVTVKGTNISTVTDRKGNFVLEDVPVILDSIEVTKNGKSKTLPIPIEITMTEALNDRYVAWYVKAAGGFTSVYGEGVGGSTFYAGGGMDVRLGRHGAYQMGLYYNYRKLGDVYTYYYDDYNYYGMDFDFHSVEIPILFANKFRMANRVIMQIGLGAFVNYTFNAKATMDGVSESANPNAFGGGPLVDFGWEIRRHWLVNFTGRFGWIESNDYFDGISYMDWSLSFGYKF
ncbi:MAG TPA: outer membrane beta-barrel protein [Candidatus Bacteroides merdigallinarum]|uniref:Outer membrane beta-barrel protein n=1 Tax=Candidatus Bacteroides merdigallinarum TaxID=2838473 RepID=A0A9D2E892_9BACE|nr:outer membrane beta-barrel protein [Candidatus Bacteroides merdigallinarum]